MIVIIYLFFSQIFIEVNSLNHLLAPNDLTNSKQGRKAVSAHQSLTLLMNFKNDGTTSFQIMQGTLLENHENLSQTFVFHRITSSLFG